MIYTCLMLDFTQPQIHFALRAVEEALPLAGLIQKELAGRQVAKQDQSPVTVADFSIQAVIGYRLSQAFPEDPFVAEESSKILRDPAQQELLQQVLHYVRRVIPEATEKKICAWIDHGLSEKSDKFWTLDPIDGTKGFLRNAQYATALALIERGKVQLGVLGCPHLTAGHKPDLAGPGSLICAVRGKGAWARSLNESSFSQLSVSKRQNPADAVLMGSVDPGHTDMEKLEILMKELGVTKKPMLMDSQAKYAALAGGSGDFFLYFLPQKKPQYRMKIWDVAPGAIVVEEAGGKVTDLTGQPIDFSCGSILEKNPGLVASNPYLHPKIISILRRFYS